MGSFWVTAPNPTTTYVYHAVYVGGKHKNILFHREIMKAPKEMEVDHKFGNGLDNRKRFLRLATTAQNCRNKRPKKSGTSKYLGVSWDKRKSKWYATIWSGNKARPIGFFDIEMDAARAYDERAAIFHGEFARLNFPSRDNHPG